MAQLDDNLAAAHVALAAAHVARLDALSAPSLPFPCGMAALVPAIVNGGTSINGVKSPAWANTPANDDERSQRWRSIRPGP